MFLQRTIRKKAEVQGVGIHSGNICKLIFKPAPVDTGVYFVRTDLVNQPSLKVSAKYVEATTMQTTIGNAFFSVATVEHCLSALSALRIDNLIIELDGPEIPICDGSAKDFCQALMAVGLVEQDQPRKYCYITQPIYLSDSDKHAYVVPYHGLRLTVTIDFPHPVIGRQKIDIDINEQTYSREIANARTFGFLKDVEILQTRGLARGASLENAIGLDENKVVNSTGLRWSDEFVRHKVLDALGDLTTLEMPLMGHLTLYKAGHDLMNKLVCKIKDSPGCYRFVELGADISQEVKKFSGWTVPATTER
jgi:UDP-3-O-[3-hydroxymyristoyl] N-acetylglucosamine deacetylase